MLDNLPHLSSNVCNDELYIFIKCESLVWICFWLLGCHTCYFWSVKYILSEESPPTASCNTSSQNSKIPEEKGSFTVCGTCTLQADFSFYLHSAGWNPSSQSCLWTAALISLVPSLTPRQRQKEASVKINPVDMFFFSPHLQREPGEFGRPGSF